ncbi:hypothetical protein ACF0H5_021835 [Mactra antiquata]
MRIRLTTRNRLLHHIYRRWLLFLVIVLIGVFVFFVIDGVQLFHSMLGVPTKIMLPEYAEDMHIKPLQPEVTSDFPGTFTNNPIIPQILHQTWKTNCLTDDMAKYIKTFADWNPRWRYYFWTDETGRDLIAKRHPALLKVWDNVSKGVQRGDILRYVVLYEFGGMYTDLDVQFLRNLDQLTYKYSCIVSPEPFEHSAFLYKLPFVINNAILLCKPKHPFFKKLLDSLQEAVNAKDVMDSTGPRYVTNIFQKYTGINYQSVERDDNDISKSEPYFYNTLIPETDPEHVYVPNSHYLMDEINRNDKSLPRHIQTICNDLKNSEMLFQRGCVEVAQKGLHRKNTNFAFTRHEWIHTWLHPLEFKNLWRQVSACQPIDKIISDRYMYNWELDAMAQ